MRKVKVPVLLYCRSVLLECLLSSQNARSERTVIFNLKKMRLTIPRKQPQYQCQPKIIFTQYFFVNLYFSSPSLFNVLFVLAWLQSPRLQLNLPQLPSFPICLPAFPSVILLFLLPHLSLLLPPPHLVHGPLHPDRQALLFLCHASEATTTTKQTRTVGSDLLTDCIISGQAEPH